MIDTITEDMTLHSTINGLDDKNGQHSTAYRSRRGATRAGNRPGTSYFDFPTLINESADAISGDSSSDTEIEVIPTLDMAERNATGNSENCTESIVRCALNGILDVASKSAQEPENLNDVSVEIMDVEMVKGPQGVPENQDDYATLVDSSVHEQNSNSSLTSSCKQASLKNFNTSLTPRQAQNVFLDAVVSDIQILRPHYKDAKLCELVTSNVRKCKQLRPEAFSVIKQNISGIKSLTMPPSQVVGVLTEYAAQKPLREIRQALGTTMVYNEGELKHKLDFIRFNCPAFTRFLYDVGHSVVSDWLGSDKITQAKKVKRANQDQEFMPPVSESTESNDSSTSDVIMLNNDKTDESYAAKNLEKSVAQLPKPKFFVCAVGRCRFSTDTMFSLSRHREIPHKDHKTKRYICGMCLRDPVFKTHRQHEMTHHMAKQHNTRARFIEFCDQDAQRSCPYCQKSILPSALMTKHFRMCPKMSFGNMLTQLRCYERMELDETDLVNQYLWPPPQKCPLLTKNFDLRVTKSLTGPQVPNQLKPRQPHPPALTNQIAAMSMHIKSGNPNPNNTPIRKSIDDVVNMISSGRVVRMNSPRKAIQPRPRPVLMRPYMPRIALPPPPIISRPPMRPAVAPQQLSLTVRTLGSFPPSGLPVLTRGPVANILNSAMISVTPPPDLNPIQHLGLVPIAPPQLSLMRPRYPAFAPQLTSMPRPMSNGPSNWRPPSIRPPTAWQHVGKKMTPIETKIQNLKHHVAKAAAQPTPPKASDKEFCCELCDANFVLKQSYVIHLRAVHNKLHSEDYATLIESPPLLSCSRCRKRFFTCDGLERHLLMVHGLVSLAMLNLAKQKKDGAKCSRCDKSFSFNIVQHMVNAHQMTLRSAEVVFSCDLCSQPFKEYHKLQEHIKVSHKKTEPQTFVNRKGVGEERASVNQLFSSSSKPNATNSTPKSSSFVNRLLRYKILNRNIKFKAASRSGAPSAPPSASCAQATKVVKFCCTPCQLKFPTYGQVIEHWRQRHLRRVSVSVCRIDRCVTCRTRLVLSGVKLDNVATSGDNVASPNHNSVTSSPNRNRYKRPRGGEESTTGESTVVICID